MNDLSFLLQKYDINSYLVNSKRELGLTPLLNLLQDSASTHANALGFGYEQMQAAGTFWVLSRQKLQMKKWPKWHQTLTIKTWIRKSGGPFSHRDFILYCEDEQIGECTTSWVTVDALSRKAVLLDRSSTLSQLKDLGQVSFDSVKISRQEQLSLLAKFTVRNSDLDHNQHVNNTKYAQWIMDALPLKWFSTNNLAAYSVNFLAETFHNDCIQVFSATHNPLDSLNDIYFEGVRESDGKCVFTARLSLQAI